LVHGICSIRALAHFFITMSFDHFGFLLASCASSDLASLSTRKSSSNLALERQIIAAARTLDEECHHENRKQLRLHSTRKSPD